MDSSRTMGFEDWSAFIDSMSPDQASNLLQPATNRLKADVGANAITEAQYLDLWETLWRKANSRPELPPQLT